MIGLVTMIVLVRCVVVFTENERKKKERPPPLWSFPSDLKLVGQSRLVGWLVSHDDAQPKVDTTFLPISVTQSRERRAKDPDQTTTTTTAADQQIY